MAIHVSNIHMSSYSKYIYDLITLVHRVDALILCFVVSAALTKTRQQQTRMHQNVLFISHKMTKPLTFSIDEYSWDSLILLPEPCNVFSHAVAHAVCDTPRV